MNPVWTVELRKYDKNNSIDCMLSFIGSSLNAAENFMKDRSQSAGEYAAWWFCQDMAIDHPNPIGQFGTQRIYDLYGNPFMNDKGKFVQPTRIEATLDRFQGDKINIHALTRRDERFQSVL